MTRLRAEAKKNPVVLAQCVLFAMHDPDAYDGVPALVGSCYLAEALLGLISE